MVFVFCFSRCVRGFVSFLSNVPDVNLKSKPVFRRGPAEEDTNSRKSLFEVPIIDLNKIFTKTITTAPLKNLGKLPVPQK